MVRKKWVYQPSVACSSYLLKAKLDATSTKHLNLQQNCLRLSCIVGNIGADKEEEGINFDISCLKLSIVNPTVL